METIKVRATIGIKKNVGLDRSGESESSVFVMFTVGDSEYGVIYDLVERTKDDIDPEDAVFTAHLVHESKISDKDYVTLSTDEHLSVLLTGLAYVLDKIEIRVYAGCISKGESDSQILDINIFHKTEIFGDLITALEGTFYGYNLGPK